MPQKPALSVIMPTYNRAGTYLKQSIESCLSQSFNDFELIVLDDCSQDSTPALVAAMKDPRIVYFRADSNRGEYWLTNYGMGMAKGTHVTWLHSDDLLPPDSLKKRMEALQNNPGLDFVHGDITKIDPQDRPIETLASTDETSNSLYRTYVSQLAKGEMTYLVHHTTVMMKRGFFYRTGPFDGSLPFAGDIDWLVRALRIGSFRRVPAILYLYRKHAGARTVTDLKEGVDKIQVRKSIAQRYL